MTKTTLFFSVAFLMILVSCGELPNEPEVEEEEGVVVPPPITPEPPTPPPVTNRPPLPPPPPVTNIDGIDYLENPSIDITFHPNGHVKSGELGRVQSIPIELNGDVLNTIFAASESTLTFYPTGLVKSAILLKGTPQRLNVGEQMITFDSFDIQFHEATGQVKRAIVLETFSQNLRVGGQVIMFGGGISSSTGGAFTFYPDGSIKSGPLPNGQVNIPVQVGENTILFSGASASFGGGPITFHPGGEVATGVLHTSTTPITIKVGGNMISFGAGPITFHPNEEVATGILHTSTSIRGQVYPQGMMISFDDSGNVL